MSHSAAWRLQTAARRSTWWGQALPRPSGGVSRLFVSRDSRTRIPTRSRSAPAHHGHQSSLLSLLSLQSYKQHLATVPTMDWIWNQVKVPKGFDNFFPKGYVPKPNDKANNNKKKKATDNTESAGTDSSSQKDHDGPSSTEKRQDARNKSGHEFRGNNNNNNNNSSNNNTPPQDQVAGWAAALLLIVLLRSLLEDDDPPSREITWEKVFPLLEQQKVEKIVVVNKRLARVYLKQGQTQEQFEYNHHAGGNTSSSSSTDGGGASPQEWNDATIMDLGVSAKTSTTNSGSVLMSRNSMAQSRHAGTTEAQRHLHFYIGSVESFEDKLEKAQQAMGRAPRDYVSVQYSVETNWALELIKLTPALIMLGILVSVFRNVAGISGAGGRGGAGGIFQIGKSNAKKINKEDVTVSFKDVAGCQEAKKEIMEFVDFLQDSSRFTKLGAKIPKGALLCGPPGTGKTLLAKAVAGEASVPFYSISGSDFIEMFVGVGPSRVRDLFKEARQNAPCIVFIDEIDAVGRQRGKGGFSGGNDERENTLNQLLVEMDGFSPTTGVVVLAGTNRVDILDQALTRPGRFDRQIQVDKPDLEGRKEIFLVHLNGIKLEDDAEDIAGRLAGLTPGFAGADIANICNEAAIVAARRKGESVSIEDFEKATDRIIGGLESNKIMSKEERSVVAHHEAGHAVAGWFLEHADPLLKVTIIPRSSGALGYAQYLPKEVFLRTQEQIMDIVCMALAGRASEEVFFGKVTTGASDDLKRVTELVYSTIQVYGMNSRVGQLAFQKNPNAAPGEKPYSDATAEAMDEEARTIVDAAYLRTVNLIRERKDEVEKVATLLLDKETITHDDIVDLVGPRPFEGDALYKEFVSRKRRSPSSPTGTKPEEAESDEDQEAGVGGEGGGLSPGLA